MTELGIGLRWLRATFSGVVVATAALGQANGPVPVAVTPVVEREIAASIKLVGTLLADRSAVVAAEVPGVVVTFSAREGQFMAQGEVICRCDPTTARLQREEARARLGSLRARLEELENGTRPEELRRLRAAVEEATALYQKWEFERQRVVTLFERSQSSEKERHDTEMEYLAAKRRLSQNQAALEQAENGPRPEEIAQARYEVAGQEAVMRRSERDLEKTEIRAPFDGFVVAKRTEVGEWIEAGSPVCELVAIETVKARADVPESAIRFARAGEPATVEIEAFGQTQSATISRVIPRAAPAARTFPIEIDLPNADHALLPGMFVWVHVPAGPPGKRLLVSKDAIVAGGVGKQVFVIRPGPRGEKMAMPVPVNTGLESGEEIEIQGGSVRAGDLVVCRANERLYGPTPVIPTALTTSQPTTRPAQGARPR